jgi:hypothetical protein
MFAYMLTLLQVRLIRDAMFKDGLHLLKSIFELPFPFD